MKLLRDTDVEAELAVNLIKKEKDIATRGYKDRPARTAKITWYEIELSGGQVSFAWLARCSDGACT
ncbi:MAG: hypothetical protein HYV63_12375 [Candidatus Schekmanbacteria bacterium]|nr:hypothetical protein [Candidatus Schekmanbacteria bacterium]